jgi:REP element-mobilizing transposase RayT
MTNSFGPNRQSIRLPNYDYASNGAYYVTLCTQNRSLLFGQVSDATMHLSPLGRMVHKAWHEMPQFDPRISLDEHIVMPNHLHGIILIDRYSGSDPHGGRGWDPAPTIPFPDIIGRFKSWTTYQYQNNAEKWGWAVIDRRLWQRNYYDHIVRDDDDLNRIREYIRDNPKNWETDPENQK